MTEATEKRAPVRKELVGVVVSDKMDKSIVIRVDSASMHPRYRKVVRHSKKFHVHDERNDAHEGDTVRVVACRPLSKTKTWRLVEVTERAK
jgi:small subunit ribosomal protein S17